LGQQLREWWRESNEGEGEGGREPPKLVLPLVKISVKLPQACRGTAR